MDHKRMLLVEPVAILQTVMRISMSRLGWKVDLVADEKSGLEKALTKPFDLILIEISQYEMDGFSLIEQIKNQTVLNKKTPLCTLTVHNSPENRKKAHELGVDAYFEGAFLHKVAEQIDAFMDAKRQSSFGEKNE